MERNEVSAHEVRIFHFLRGHPKEWWTVLDLAAQANVARRTAALHARRLVDLGLVDIAELFPGHRYRWSGKAGKRNAAYLGRLERAAEILGHVASS